MKINVSREHILIAELTGSRISGTDRMIVHYDTIAGILQGAEVPVVSSLPVTEFIVRLFERETKTGAAWYALATFRMADGSMKGEKIFIAQADTVEASP